MKCVKKCCFYLHECVNQKGVAQKFTQSFLRFLTFNKHVKWVFEVYLGAHEFHQAGTKKEQEQKQLYQARTLMNYSCHDWMFLCLLGLFLKKHPLDIFRGDLSVVVPPYC